MGEGFKANVHVEGNCVDGGKPAIDDHDVTLVHRQREDETFQRIATKDQMRAQQLVRTEAELLTTHMQETTAPGSGAKKELSEWQLKANLHAARKKWAAAGAAHTDDFIAELAGRSAEALEMPGQCEDRDSRDQDRHCCCVG